MSSQKFRDLPSSSKYLVVVELALFASSLLLTFYLNQYFQVVDVVLLPFNAIAIYAIFFAFAVQLSSLALGLYNSKLRESFRGIIRRLLVAVAIGFFIMSLITPFFGVKSFPFELLAFSSLVTFIIASIFRYIIYKVGFLGLNKRKILVLGAGKRASIIERRMRRDVDRIGFDLVGFVPVPGDNREEGIKKEKIIHLQLNEGLRQFIFDNDIEEIIIACDQRRGTLPIEALFECKLRGTEVTELLDFMERETGQIVVNLMYPSWVIYSNGFTTQNYLRDSLDYAVNALVAFIILIFTWPFMLLTALIIYLDDGFKTGTSVFYKQERVGLNGKLFQIIKFRSMRPDAEKDGAKWASKNDDRVTRIGHFIRKYRIDELPQLFNVFKGEMAFIGPRPERPEFVEQLVREIPYYNQRHNVKPGLAGWAQLNYPYGSSVADSMEKLKFDLYYVKHQSLLLDLLILVRTTEIVLFGRGR